MVIATEFSDGFGVRVNAPSEILEPLGREFGVPTAMWKGAIRYNSISHGDSEVTAVITDRMGGRYDFLVTGSDETAVHEVTEKMLEISEAFRSYHVVERAAA
jgi:hypothetical protein